MPGYPHVDPTISALRGGVFSRLADRIAALKGEIYPLHVGDTWMEPLAAARMEALRTEDWPGLHRYTLPHGHPRLLSALERHHQLGRERILVTAGATGGLAVLAAALLSPGDEVLILSPYWPLIPGIVTCARGRPVEVPWFDGDARSPAERLAPHLSPRTVAIYVNSPHNPTGGLISPDEQQAIAAFAREHGLWIWSDEVYARLQYSGEQHPMADFAPERTFSVFSFSKAYGLAGNRCGYVIGPADPPLMLELRKAATHSFYSTPTAAQVSSAIALEQGEGWLEEARQSYAAVGREAALRLGQAPPKGGTFLFLDVRASLDESGIHGLLLKCVDRGLILAPGDACGAQYGHCLRLCFTSAPPEQVLRGVELLAQMLNRSPGLGKEFG